LDTTPFSFHSWAKFCDEPQDAIVKGMPIIAYQKRQLRKAAANCVECVVNWTRNGASVAHQVALVNAPHFMASDLAEVVYQRALADAYKMVAIWCAGKDGGVTVSVRSRGRPGDIHCGEFAKLYGGGGHPGAAGFDISLEQLPMIFLPVPTTNQIRTY
jgi:nanoRNase/pAp phosphatase (c-di-AMP/oligoRNAs hydrolase)